MGADFAYAPVDVPKGTTWVAIGSRVHPGFGVHLLVSIDKNNKEFIAGFVENGAWWVRFLKSDGAIINDKTEWSCPKGAHLGYGNIIWMSRKAPPGRDYNEKIAFINDEIQKVKAK